MDFSSITPAVVSVTTLAIQRTFLLSCVGRRLTQLLRTLLTSSTGLEHAKQLITAYKTGKIRDMTPELWKAKKIIDSTLHPGAGRARA